MDTLKLEDLRVIHASFDEIDPARWNKLVGPQVGSRYEWLEMHRAAGALSGEIRFVLVFQVEFLVAGLYYFEHHAQEPKRSLDASLWGGLAPVVRRLGLTLAPAWICAEPASNRAPVFGPSLPALMALREAHRCARQNRATFCLRNLPDSHPLCRSLNFLQSPENPTCLLSIGEYRNFAEYLRALRRTHRSTQSTIRNEANKARKSGFVFEVVRDPAPIADELQALMNSHCLRLNGVLPRIRKDYFGLLKDHLGEDAQVLVCRRDKSLVGFTILLQSDQRGWACGVGIDDQFVRKHGIYGTLVFSTLIELAIEEGLEEIDYGVLVYGMKLRRGCRLQPRSLFLAPKNLWHRLLLPPLLFVRTLLMRKRNSKRLSGSLET